MYFIFVWLILCLACWQQLSSLMKWWQLKTTCVFFITKHFMYFVFAMVWIWKSEWRTVSSNTPDFKEQSQEGNFSKFQYPASTFSCLPKGVEVFNTRIYIKWSSNWLVSISRYLSVSAKVNRQTTLLYFPNCVWLTAVKLISASLLLRKKNGNFTNRHCWEWKVNLQKKNILDTEK